MSGKKTICLNMIVKNEGHIIAETLEHLLKFITFDYWVISDTGSTDKTKEIIVDFFKARKIPGQLVEHAWRDFGYNRTKAFEAAYNKTDYVFVWDADDEVSGNFKMPSDLTADSYKFIFGSSDGFRYSRPQLFNNRKRWCYKGVLHEYAAPLEPCSPDQNVLGDYYFISGRKGDRSKDPNKYYKDAMVLEKAIEKAIVEKDPLYNRYVFYCAQSYNSCNMHEKAIEWYKKALTIEMWIQEKYVSCLEIYDQYEVMNRPQEGLYYLLESYKYDPTRIECIYRLIKYYCINGPVEAGYAYYTLIQDFYENRYDGSTLGEKLFAKKGEYDFFLPYYMVIVAQRTGHIDVAIKMFEMIFKHKFVAPEWWIRNLVHNFQFCIPNLPKNIDFLYSMLNYIDLVKSKGITLQESHDIIITRAIDTFRDELSKPSPLAQQIKSNPCSPRVMMTVTTCKRLDLFTKTVNSILNNWTDVSTIDYFYCVDDNSSDEDRAAMQKQYPFFNYYMKSAAERGHRESMNIIWAKLDELKPTYWVHLEDDWLYFRKEGYVTRAIAALEKYEPIKMHQVVFNRNYGLMYNDLDRVGGIPMEPGLILHEKRDGLVGKNCGYWPHYSLQPSVMRARVALELGNYDSPNKFFERDYADRYHAKNYMTAFFNSIYSIHIGKQHWEKDGKNAYALNEVPQFGGASAAASGATDTTTLTISGVNEPLPPNGTMREHLGAIIDKIRSGLPFGLIRPNDGERSVLLGQTLTNCDNWTFKEGGKLQKDLLEAVQTVDPNLYIGIPCNTCCKEWNCTPTIYKNFIDDFKIPLAQRTYANIFMNSNWSTFSDFIQSYKKGYFLITSGTAVSSLPIKERFVINDKLVDKWDKDGDAETDRLLRFVGSKKGELILFSAGPLSKVWIPKCMKANPTNMYVDVGAALDIFTKGTTNRLYTNKTHPFANESCHFNDKVDDIIVTSTIPSILESHQFDRSTTKKNLVYFCVFGNKDYAELLQILISSVKFYSNIDNIDFLVFTSSNLKEQIDNIASNFEIPIKTKIFEFDEWHSMYYARIYIYEYENIGLYDKVLYLDTDIIVQNDLSIIFQQDIEERVYAMKEGTIEHEYHGGQFFDFTKIDKNIIGMNSGILLFKPTKEILQIFRDIHEHIITIRKDNKHMPGCVDQPFINYHFIKNNRHDTVLLDKFGLIYCYDPPLPPSGPTNVVLCHFVWPIGNAAHKKDRMVKHFTHVLNHYLTIKGGTPIAFTEPDLSEFSYKWGGNGAIKFKGNGILETTWMNGTYQWLDSSTVEANWAGCYHTIRMNSDYNKAFTIRKGDILCGMISKTIIENSPAIILTMTVQVGRKSVLCQVDPEERKNLYIKTIRQWLTNTQLKVVVVENSGYTFEELSEERKLYGKRFEIITYNEYILPESSYLVNITDKGSSELFSINYAYKKSALLKISNFIIKITGRYYIPGLEQYLKQHDLNVYDGLHQHDKTRCELIGSHVKNFHHIFKSTRDNINYEITPVEGDFCDRLANYKKLLVCDEFTIEPTIQGSTGKIITQI